MRKVLLMFIFATVITFGLPGLVHAGEPRIFSTPVTSAEVAIPYVYDVGAFGTPLPTFNLEQAPDGMTIDPISGLIEWIPDRLGIFTVAVVASNIYGEDQQTFSVFVGNANPPYTTCWPEITYSLKALENDRILNISIFNEDNDQVVLESIRVQGKMQPYTEARIEGDSIVTDCFILKFFGISGWRPIPSEGIMDEYTVEYDRIDGSHVVLTGDYLLGMVVEGDVNFDGHVNDDDLKTIRDYLFNRGEVEFEEFMDIDGNGRIDLRDMQELIRIIGD